MNKKWFVKRTNTDFIRYLSKSTSVSPALAQILINRGMNTPQSVKDFLNPETSLMLDPGSLPDMDKAVKRIQKASLQKEKVLIQGDYDADGVTSTAILVLTLRKLGIECDFFIPNRFDHGYGFHIEAIQKAASLGATLIITVDCGINSFEEVLESKKRGIDVIITDHHEPYSDENGSFLLPKAEAVINPKLISPVPRHDMPLSGAGVALKLSQALLGNSEYEEFFDLAAIGTIADMVPLLNDNRVIVKKGLELINDGSRVSIEALREVASAQDRTVNTNLLSYTIIPRINASGRMAEASEVVKLFISEHKDEIFTIARTLNMNNQERQRIEENVLKEALSMLQGKSHDHCIVLYKKGWHEGVIGIVASKIADIFQKPTFIFSINHDIAKGSARSFSPFDIAKGLSLCSDCLIKYGGHKQAAGLTLSAQHLPDFEKRMDAIIAQTLTDNAMGSVLMIDAEVTLQDINFLLMKQLSQLEPFGLGNEEPVLAARGLEVMSPKIVGNNHLKMRLRHRSHSLDAIGFDMGNKFGHLDDSGLIDAVFIPTINEWNGGRHLQLHVRAFRPSRP